MRRLDVGQDAASGALTLLEQGRVGVCLRECNTLAAACRRALEGQEVGLGEELYRSVQRKASHPQCCPPLLPRQTLPPRLQQH